jgi:hypothetical protein
MGRHSYLLASFIALVFGGPALAEQVFADKGRNKGAGIAPRDADRIGVATEMRRKDAGLDVQDER